MTVLGDSGACAEKLDSEIFAFENLQYLKLSAVTPSPANLHRFTSFTDLEQLIIQNQTLSEESLFVLLQALQRTKVTSMYAETRFPTSNRVLHALTSSLQLKTLGLSFVCLPFPTGRMAKIREKRRYAKFSKLCARFATLVKKTGFPEGYVLKRSDIFRFDYVCGAHYYVNGVEHIRRPYKTGTEMQDVPVFT